MERHRPSRTHVIARFEHCHRRITTMVSSSLFRPNQRTATCCHGLPPTNLSPCDRQISTAAHHRCRHLRTTRSACNHWIPAPPCWIPRIGRKNGGHAPPRWLCSACYLSRSGCCHHRIDAPSSDPYSPSWLSAARASLPPNPMPSWYLQPPNLIACAATRVDATACDITRMFCPPRRWPCRPLSRSSMAAYFRISHVLPTSATTDRLQDLPLHAILDHLVARNHLHAPVRNR
ncbi:hypothetical protein COCNU_scaffold011475G000010 [Cocos nucifera]|nr:hypothetical protein [Cocos nucifera]